MEKQKRKLLEWLYINDGNFKSVNEWRKAFLEELYSVIEEKEAKNAKQ